MPRTGPVTKDTTTIALGLAQIRVIGASATYIGQVAPILAAANSVGALASTRFVGNTDFFKLESGFPLLEDAVFPLREAASLELAFKEITPKNMALARGLDPDDYSAAHTGALPLGTVSTPEVIRMEAVYTYPDGTNTMTIIFPRAQVVANTEVDFASEEPAAVAITIESKRADSEVTGGHIIWDGMPLGRIVWNDGTNTTTTTSSTTTTTAP